MSAGSASMVVQYGHGLFGSRAEIEVSNCVHNDGGLQRACRRVCVQSGWIVSLAESSRWVVIAADWQGMSHLDVPTALRIFLVGEERRCTRVRGARFSACDSMHNARAHALQAWTGSAACQTGHSRASSHLLFLRAWRWAISRRMLRCLPRPGRRS